MAIVFGWIDRSASSADLVLGNGSRALTCIALHRNDLDLSRCPSKTRTAAHWQSSLWTFLIVSSDGGSQKQNDCRRGTSSAGVSRPTRESHRSGMAKQVRSDLALFEIADEDAVRSLGARPGLRVPMDPAPRLPALWCPTAGCSCGVSGSPTI